MDHQNLSKKLSDLMGPDCRVERLGHTQIPLIEVQSGKIAEIANFLRFEEHIRMDWLEMMSAFEVRGKITVSYFLRSESNRNHVVLRTEVTPKHPKDHPTLQSVSEVWRMALPYEVEMGEQFGIVFSGMPQNRGSVDRGIHFEEAPLRKQFVWEGELFR